MVVCDALPYVCFHMCAVLSRPRSALKCTLPWRSYVYFLKHVVVSVNGMRKWFSLVPSLLYVFTSRRQCAFQAVPVGACIFAVRRVLQGDMCARMFSRPVLSYVHSHTRVRACGTACEAAECVMKLFRVSLVARAKTVIRGASPERRKRDVEERFFRHACRQSDVLFFGLRADPPRRTDTRRQTGSTDTMLLTGTSASRRGVCALLCFAVCFISFNPCSGMSRHQQEKDSALCFMVHGEIFFA